MQYENASLKAQLTEALTRNVDVTHTEKKLAQSEHDHREYKKNMEKEMSNKTLEIKVLEDKVRNTDKYSEWFSLGNVVL